MKTLFDEFDIEQENAIITATASEKITLRPYQVESVANVYKQWEDIDSTLVCLPTGTGKSVVFSDVMRRWDVENYGRILLIAHRKELIIQAVGHAQRAGLTAGIEMGSRWASGEEDVIVSSVQTLNATMNCPHCMKEGCDRCQDGRAKRMTRFNPRDFGLVTLDEAHHSVAKSWRSVLTYFRQNKTSKTLLVTATPKRTDNKGLHTVCDSVAYEMQLREAIDQGWLVPIRQQFITVDGLDISQVKTSKGDLSESGLQSAFLAIDPDEERALHAIVKPTIDIASGRQCLVFASGQDIAAKLAASFNSHGVYAASVVDSTPPKERDSIVAAFKSGELPVLVNCMVFTEGFDCPSVEVIVNCRPTKSESLLLQIIGRGTRPEPGVVDGPETAEERKAAIAASRKPYCTILDFVGNSGNHKLKTVVDLLAGDSVKPVDIEEALQVAQRSSEAVDMVELAEKLKTAREEREKRAEESRIKRLLTRTKADKADYTAIDVDLFSGKEFDYESGQTVEMASRQQCGFLFHRLGMSWNKAKKLTKKQASAIISATYKKVTDDWKQLINSASDKSDLAKIGKAIDSQKGIDHLLKSEKVLNDLREEWKRKRSEFVNS